MQTGLFGTKETFVPVQGAEISGDRVTLQYEKATVKDAPNVDEDGRLSPQEEEQLYRFYGVQYAGGVASGQAAGASPPAVTLRTWRRGVWPTPAMP